MDSLLYFVTILMERLVIDAVSYFIFYFYSHGHFENTFLKYQLVQNLTNTADPASMLQQMARLSNSRLLVKRLASRLKIADSTTGFLLLN